MPPRARLAASVALAATTLLAGGYAVAVTIGPAAFVPSGTSRYAMVSRTMAAANNATTTSTSYVDMPGMSTDITIPDGKRAEVIVTFSGMVNTCSAMYVRALVGGNVANPDGTQFLWDHDGGAESHAFTFFRTARAGTHTVKIQWKGLSSCSQQFVSARSMVVIANIHS